jgi:hypothetical protein
VVGTPIELDQDQLASIRLQWLHDSRNWLCHELGGLHLLFLSPAFPDFNLVAASFPATILLLAAETRPLPSEYAEADG